MQLASCELHDAGQLLSLSSRQIHRDFRKPLIVVAPRTCSVTSVASSNLEDMGPGTEFNRKETGRDCRQGRRSQDTCLLHGSYYELLIERGADCYRRGLGPLEQIALPLTVSPKKPPCTRTPTLSGPSRNPEHGCLGLLPSCHDGHSQANSNESVLVSLAVPSAQRSHWYVQGAPNEYQAIMDGVYGMSDATN
jgi:hypothetical protein